MPDTMIATETSPALTPASCGVMEGFRSPSIGKLALARAHATKEIKSIIKDKTADIQGKPGGRSFKYAYADLASVMEAVEDALAAAELAVFQTLQDRKGATYLITTLAHSSDQWISSELKVSSVDVGPQVFGSALTYARRYAVLAALALAPEADDDGRAAQDRADQQSRQKPQDRAEAPRSSNPTPKPVERTQRHPSGSDEPHHIPMASDAGGFLIRDWLGLAKAAIDGQPEAWRRRWLELHQQELADLRSMRPEWADKVEAAAIAPDLAEAAE
jgi:hypothetical protein